jgi:hypothetical protein
MIETNEELQDCPNFAVQAKFVVVYQPYTSYLAYRSHRQDVGRANSSNTQNIVASYYGQLEIACRPIANAYVSGGQPGHGPQSCTEWGQAPKLKGIWRVDRSGCSPQEYLLWKG